MTIDIHKFWEELGFTRNLIKDGIASPWQNDVRMIYIVYSVWILLGKFVGIRNPQVGD